MGQTADFGRLLVAQINGHAHWYYTLAYRILRNAAEAEDICQNAFTTAWERRDQIRDPQALRSWLSRVVVHQSLQICRRRKREQKWACDRRHANAVESGDYESVEFQECFANALAELPEMTQTVVVLRLVQQMSGNEVKNVLGCSASEVSRRLHTGMEHLRTRLANTFVADR